MNFRRKTTPSTRSSVSFRDTRLSGTNQRGRGVLKLDLPTLSKGLTSNKEADVITVNLDDIRTRLGRLRHVAHKPIRSLSGSELDDYQALVRYMRLLYDTDAYKVYHDEVKNAFKNLESVDINAPEPGTVGAFFIGCVATDRSSHPELGCSAICAGAMPLPKEDNQSNIPKKDFCPYTVVLAIAKGQGYEMKTLYEGDNKDQMIVYVDSSSEGREFTGFNDDEKAELAKYKVGTIKILKYLPDRKTYIDVTNGSGRLDEIPSRVDVITNNSAIGGSGSLFAILLIVLIILVVFIGWRIMASRQT